MNDTNLNFIFNLCDDSAIKKKTLKEMDTYKIGTVRNSCSTMHMITKEFVDSLSKEELEILEKLLNAYKEDMKENDDRSRHRDA